MADYKQIVPLILEKEGGMSKHPSDRASRNPSPCTYKGVKGWHTNKGIQWRTFTSFAPKLGYEASCHNFLKMPPDIWGKIFKQGFWDRWGLDNMKSQPIADTIVWWSFGSGVGGATKLLKKFLAKKGMNPTTRSGIVKDLDKLAEKDSEKLFDELTAHRMKFYAGLSTANKFLRGWTNAYNRFTTYSKGYMSKAKKYGAKGVAKSFAKDPIKFARRNWIPLTVLVAVGGIITYFVFNKLWKK